MEQSKSKLCFKAWQRKCCQLDFPAWKCTVSRGSPRLLACGGRSTRDLSPAVSSLHASTYPASTHVTRKVLSNGERVGSVHLKKNSTQRARYMQCTLSSIFKTKRCQPTNYRTFFVECNFMQGPLVHKV